MCLCCRYGAAVHFKIYPIVYALAFLVVRLPTGRRRFMLKT
jgi:hypothetical protein